MQKMEEIGLGLKLLSINQGYRVAGQSWVIKMQRWRDNTVYKNVRIKARSAADPQLFHAEVIKTGLGLVERAHEN